MATSGSVDYSVDRDDIITEALELLGVLGEGETPNSNQLTSSARSLNMLVKSWQNRCKHLHVMQDLYVFMDGSAQFFTLDGTTDHVASSYSKTALSADAASGASSITVDSITGFSDGDNIGVELDDGTRQWTTINGAPSGSTITLTATLNGAAAPDNTVVAYTSKANNPVRIDGAYIQTITTPTKPIDTPVEIINRMDHVNLSNKETTGRPTQIYPDYQRASTKLYIWPITNSVDHVLGLKAWRTIEDFDAASDDADFPQEWYLTLAYQLAVKLAPKYGYPVNNLVLLKREADELLFDAESAEVEESIRFQPHDRQF